ncbi:MAG: DUF4190 domain-containing protein [Planctomycetaceae bacterium]|nr:DUF4190 domain-containing protein [Planctomycetaceae bacterium]
MSEFYDRGEGLEGPGYRAVSRSAVLALLLGVSSMLAPVYIVFWIFPLATITVAILALRGINRIESNLTGRGLAVTGLLLALLFGSMAPARHYMRKTAVNQQAEQFAMRWFTLLQKGSIYTAHQLLMDPKRRLSTSLIPLEEYQNDVKLKDMIEQFVSDEPIKTLVEQKEQAIYTLASQVSQSSHLQVITIKQVYHAQFQQDGSTRTIPLELSISCQYDKSSKRSYWTISDIQEAG